MSDVLRSVEKQYNGKVRKMVFRDTWLEIPEYMPWLAKNEDGSKGYCKCCKKGIKPSA